MCRERERVSYGITTKVEVTTTTIGVNRSPKRERIFLQKIKFQKVGFLRENFVGRFQNQKYVQKSREQASYFEKFKNPCQKSSLGKLWVLVVRESREKSEFEIQKSSLMIQKSKCVQLCRVYRKPNIWSPPGWIPKKSPNYHYLPMRVMFNSKFQARPSCCCQFQKVFEFFSWNQINLFHEKFHGLLWNFDVTTTTFKFWKCAESCVSILWLKKSNYPLLATSRGRCLLATSKKIQNSKICTHKIEKIRETATTTIFYPPLVWLSLSRARVNSSVISSSRVVTCITRSSSFILGLRRLAAEEGTFSKKTWLQKI